MKYLSAILLAGLLSACSLGATSPSEQPLESIGQSESMAPSADMSTDASMMASPMESAGASDDMTSGACADSWDAVDTSTVTSISDLEAIANEVGQTFSDCESESEWLDQAQSALPSLDSQELQTWAATQCSVDDTLSQSSVCVEING
jgi:hypothetical protein